MSQKSHDELLKRFEWQSRIKTVEKEFRAVRLAAERLLAAAKRDPTILKKNGIEPASCIGALKNLEGTYLIRLFAEFESGLRDFWKSLKQTHPPTKFVFGSNCIKANNPKRSASSR